MRDQKRIEKIKKAKERFKERLNKRPSDELVETIEEVSKMYEEAILEREESKCQD